jgi:hypothetical protein
MDDICQDDQPIITKLQLFAKGNERRARLPCPLTIKTSLRKKVFTADLKKRGRRLYERRIPLLLRKVKFKKKEF